MSAVLLIKDVLLGWHELRAAQEADRRQVLADAQRPQTVFGDLNDLVSGFLTSTPQVPSPLRWRAINERPEGTESVVIATRKHGDADWMLLSGLWRYTENGWREEMCNAPLPQPHGWDYRWMDELALIALLPTTSDEVRP